MASKFAATDIQLPPLTIFYISPSLERCSLSISLSSVSDRGHDVYTSIIMCFLCGPQCSVWHINNSQWCALARPKYLASFTCSSNMQRRECSINSMHLLCTAITYCCNMHTCTSTPQCSECLLWVRMVWRMWRIWRTLLQCAQCECCYIFKVYEHMFMVWWDYLLVIHHCNTAIAIYMYLNHHRASHSIT